MAHIQVNYYNKINVTLPYTALRMRVRAELWQGFFFKLKVRNKVYSSGDAHIFNMSENELLARDRLLWSSKSMYIFTWVLGSWICDAQTQVRFCTRLSICHYPANICAWEHKWIGCSSVSVSPLMKRFLPATNFRRDVSMHNWRMLATITNGTLHFFLTVSAFMHEEVTTLKST